MKLCKKDPHDECLYFTHISEVKFRMIREEEQTELIVSGLYDGREIRRLMYIRRAFERRLRREPKNLRLYYKFIQNEFGVLRHTTLRRIRRFGLLHEKVDDIDFVLLHRIRVLYESAIEINKNDNELFVKYLMFSKNYNNVSGAAELVENMLQKYPEIEHPWYSAAMWYSDIVQDKAQAKVILLRGVLKHPTKQILYKEIIKLELYNLSRHIDCKLDATTGRTGINRIEDCVDKALHHIPYAEFYISLLDLLETNSMTRPVQNMIICRLREDCYDSEKLWEFLAQRQRNDTYFTYDFPRCQYYAEDKKWITKRTPKSRLAACFAMYREGLQAMSPHRKNMLWSVYIDFLLQLYYENNGAATAFKLQTLKQAFEDASAEGNLSLKHYQAWIKMPGLSARRILAILKRANETLPDCIELWSKRFRLQMLKGPITAVENLFKECVVTLREKALPIWLSMIHYYSVTMPDAGVIALYEDGIRQPQEISDKLKPMYLDWILCYRGINAARKFYMNIVNEPPYCKGLHEAMARLEQSQINQNYDFWINIHKRACRQFGAEDVDVWLDYIKFYLHYHGQMPGALEKVEDICREVAVCLNKDLHLLFEISMQVLVERTTNFRGIVYTL